ncbi:hypothetical protein CTAYLR_007083 [Chrysophaeum taylorii]|uniref:CDC20/Fizzy WD40 domain-containing protein n=1 Tax=Chrysophaeum taylorii TaxID=2483200 RepID=A0AAD7UKD0_9STRA|nr:hypothetical protein CTAYLR_007083 [Chrysophaeum taylorii]
MLRSELLGEDRPIFRYARGCAAAERPTTKPRRNEEPLQQVEVENAKRRISNSPFKVLEAPALADDFYLDLIDWSPSNVLAIGLGSQVYLWSACTSKATVLCDLGPDDTVSSVSWTQGGAHLAVGSQRGAVRVWDAAKRKKVRDAPGHAARVGCLAWRGDCLASGSRDRTVCLRDVREPTAVASKLKAHRQEVCGLRWSPCGQYLASGGNDNKLFVWSASTMCFSSASPQATKRTTPACRFADHQAAVKAIAWSPHQRGLLASGAGSADRTIKFWNALAATNLNSIDTGSQVCALAWSRTVDELVSTHGFSLNQICLWRFDKQRRTTNYVTLTGHTHRVLYLAMSPDGASMVTGAGDATIRFWNCFPRRGGPGTAHHHASVLVPPFGGTVR